MHSPIPSYLDEVLQSVAADRTGVLANYIPELAEVDPERLGASIAMVDGELYASGDTDSLFTIQSISKPFVYALALADRGFEKVLDKVGVEPSGEPFNEISLEDSSGRPLNPMINAGAITTHSLVGTETMNPAERMERVISGLSAFAGRSLDVDEAVYSSEIEHAHRNLAIAHMLRSHDILTENPAGVVEGYTRQCSLLVTVQDLAMMAATLANYGIQPVTGEQVVPKTVVRQVLSVMFTCGMYNAAGDWATQVGIPAKSGVGGGIIGAVPGQLGLATFSPRLDVHGNSVRGVSLFERFSSDMGMHVMNIPTVARSAIRANYRIGSGEKITQVIQLQGRIRFAGAERVIREIVDTHYMGTRIALDVTRVYSVDEVAQHMLLEIMRRMRHEGYTVYLIDQDDTITNLEALRTMDVAVLGSIDELEYY
ncbi:glutaminase A [Rothia dentocariosa ATCC 17931]|uniref:Glutaminase n=1 Tax=Rothia dentocariosa (strain ATCC 17931 / CDC X599 / XDIA) TaxID=762948 RepID=E3H384_ROTDC|nr:glutaminase [Rothia dentocariosa]ADP41519.1 glutaminase A [Rothia dentocariosa ATCC 17931]WMS32241.1 glutaminase [Rothia dentocariosa]SUE38394.1 Glutaminase [Rothia dentocariosa]